MRPLLRAELLKLRTTRTFVALVGSALALSLLVVVLTTTIPHDLVRQDVRELFTADFSSLFILLLGVMGMAGEWRHRTITGTVLASANRLRLLAAKIISYAIAGMVLSLIVTVTIMLVGTAILSLRDLPALGFGDLLDVLWRNLVVAAFAGAFGVVVGALVRNQVVAIVGLLVFAFAVEPALLAVAPDVGRFGPTSGAPNAVIDTGSFGGETPLAPGIAILVLAGWVGAGFAAAQQMLRRRDLV